MSGEQERYYPAGGMCMACTKSDHDCSRLNFASMPVLYRSSLVIAIVKCTEFEAKAKS